MNQNLPAKYPDCLQGCVEHPNRWMPSLEHPYPMTFNQAPSARHQVLVNYQGKNYLQGLSPVKGPYMYPVKERCNRGPINSYERKHSAIVYPTTHSMPGPCLQSYIALPNKMYMY